MPDLKRLSILIMVFLLTFSCVKIEGPAADVYKTWEVKEFVAVGENSENAGGVPIYFSIYDDGHYSLELDKNSCNGTILNITDKYIILGAPACTEMCCDSEFAIRFAELVSAISMYKMADNMLRLYIEGWGFIECELVPVD